MIIKEGSILEIIEGSKNSDNVIVEKIDALEDIEFENNGDGYTFLLRNTGNDRNAIFEADGIILENGIYKVYGYFKDAISISVDRYGNEASKSYMED